MKAVFKKKADVETAESYMVLEIEKERRDIQDYLIKYQNTRIVYDNQVINERIISHLKSIGILDSKSSITDEGEIVLKTGKIFEKEEGKYKVWFIKDDSFLDDTIIHIERIDPTNLKNNTHSENTIQDEKLNIFDKTNTLLPVDSTETSAVKFTPFDKKRCLYISDKKKAETLEIEWVWNDLESSSYKVKGKIDNKNIKDNNFSYDKDLKLIIERIFKDCFDQGVYLWDKTYEKLRMKFYEVMDSTQKEKFSLDWTVENKYCFDEISFSKISLMPYDEASAVEWRNWLLIENLKKEYYLSNKFNIDCRKINGNDAFKAFKKALLIPKVDKFRDELYDSDRTKRSVEYWHLAAPEDLNPDGNITIPYDRFSFKPGDSTSFKEIADKIREDNDYKYLFYIDKYTHKKRHQEKLSVYLKEFASEKIYLITPTKNDKLGNRSDYLLKNNQEIEQHDYDKISAGRKNHDRYIVLANDKNDMVVWAQTASMDFINFEDHTITAESSGTTEDISFIKLTFFMLKEDLRNFIMNNISQGKNE